MHTPHRSQYPASAAPQDRNWHIRAEHAGRFHTNSIKLHAILIVKGWFYPKLEIVRMILNFVRLAQEQVTGARDQVTGCGW